MRKRKWNEAKFGKMTFGSICQRYSDEPLKLKPEFLGRLYLNKGNYQYAISWNRFETYANFTGWCLKQTKFILLGECEITINNKTYFLKKGDYIFLPTGKSHFKLVGVKPFEYVSVCKLPSSFPKIENNGDTLR